MTAPLHVGLNLIFLVPGETGGMEVVARELIPRLVDIAPAARFTSFINREAQEAGDGPWMRLTETVTVPVRARSRPQWVVGEQVLLPRLATSTGIDVVHSLGNTGPSTGDFARVVTVHDLIYKAIPEAHFGVRSLGMRVLVPLGVRRAHRVMADSNSTKDDLGRHLRVPPAKVDVVPLGVGVTGQVKPADSRTLRTQLGLDDRSVLLTLSAKRPHKNLVRLLEALACLPAGDRPVLVLPGYPTPHEAELRHRTRELDLHDDVRFLGWTSADILEGLYVIASGFVYPSLYEGFGLPVLEAMARGVPVACSNTTSLPEVAGEAALLFDPESVEDIASAIRRLLTDQPLVARLREAGRNRARRFSWERTAELTLESYRRAVASRAVG